MDLIICFIDDSAFEHDLVRSEIAPAGAGFTFVQASTFEQAVEMLGSRIPLLFLLDLWGKDPEVETPYLTPREELEELTSHFKTLDSVYEGLEGIRGDWVNEYLKRLFAVVDSWRNLFEMVCSRVGQNRKFGLANLHRAREFYPGVPGVFYTRKALMNDAVAMFRAGADGLFIKPTGSDDAHTRAITRDYAPALLSDLALIIDRHVDLLRMHISFYGEGPATKRTDVEGLISLWKKFRNT